MTITLYHHPYSRAANVVWMLEETGVPYELYWVDILKGGSKAPEILKLNPMGKLPVLTDGDVVVTESAACGLYLADRYALGRLAPKPDDPARAGYLRWSLFAPSVIEPGTMAKANGWAFKETQAGWGNYDLMLKALESVLQQSTYVLGDTFSMADCILGGTLGWMLRSKAIEARPAFAAYWERLNQRPAWLRSMEKNMHAATSHGLDAL